VYSKWFFLSPKRCFIPAVSAWAISLTVSILSAPVCAQDYPHKPIRIIAASAGSSGDFAARLIAQGITGVMGQQVIVENRGGSVTISGELVAKAPPDGYTLLFMPSSLWCCRSCRTMFHMIPCAILRLSRCQAVPLRCWSCIRHWV